MNNALTSQLLTVISDCSHGEVIAFDTIGSTNDYAMRRAKEGVSDISVYYAADQTNGRGRMNRSWAATPGSSLAFSIVIQPSSEELPFLNLFSPLTGISVTKALQKRYGIRAEIKWPNDILLHKRKICGILCEMNWEGDTLSGLILGIGINLLKDSVPKLSGMVFPPSSIETETGIQSKPFLLIHDILKAIQEYRPLLGTDTFLKTWEKQLAFLNETVKLVAPDGTQQIVTVRGIDSEGSLLVEANNRGMQHIPAGELSLRPINTNEP